VISKSTEVVGHGPENRSGHSTATRPGVRRQSGQPSESQSRAFSRR
jgi:hypothetical protein